MERPQNVVDIFEEMSKMLKQERYISQFDVIHDEFEPTLEFHLADAQKPLFEKIIDFDVDVVSYCNCISQRTDLWVISCCLTLFKYAQNLSKCCLSY